MSADDLICRLDDKYQHTNWNVYRAALGHWIVKVDTWMQEGDTLTEALQAAVDYVPLPVIPRRPKLLSIDGFAPRKSGSKWRLDYHGEDCCVLVDRKRDAVTAAEKMVERSQRATDDWVSQYGAMADKVEGVDFRYAY